MSVRSICLTAGLVVVLLLTGIAFWGIRACQDSAQISESVEAIVKNDMDRLERVLQEPSMRSWREYLPLERLGKILDSQVYSEQKEVGIFMVKLEEAEGVEKYPEMQTLRDSLKILLHSRKNPWELGMFRRSVAWDYVLERALRNSSSVQMVLSEKNSEEKPEPALAISRKPLWTHSSQAPLPATAKWRFPEKKTTLAQNRAYVEMPPTVPEITTISEDALPALVETNVEIAEEDKLSTLPPLPVCEKKWRALLADPKPSDTFADNPFAQTAKAWKEIAEKYVVPTDADLKAARESLLVKMEALEKLLKTDAAKEAAWKKTLLWDKLQHATQSDPVDVAGLREVHERFCQGAVGLELVRFAAVRSAIQNCVVLDASRKNPEQAKADFAKTSRMLSVLLDAAGKKMDADTQCSVEACLHWMRWMGQAPELVKQTEMLWSRPNLCLTVRQEFFDQATRPISEDQPLNEQVMNAYVTGKNHFDGTTTVRLQPNPAQVQLAVVISGTSKGTTYAYSGPVTIQSVSAGQAFAQKDVYFDSTGLLTSAATATIKANSRITNISDRFGRRLIENVAARKASEQQGMSQQILCSRQEARMGKRLDVTVDEMLARGNGQYLRLLRTQLNPRGFTPESFQMASTDKEMTVTGSLSANEGLMACSAAPAFTKASPIQMAVHETTVQNLFSGFLSGMVLNPSARETLKKTFPAGIRAALEKAASGEQEADDDTWGITFPFRNLVTTTFADGQIRVTIHTRTIQSTDKEYSDMDISVVYRLSEKDGKMFLIREGAIDVLPADFDPAVSKRLPANIVSLRRVMSRRLKEALPEEVELKAIPLDSEGNFARNMLLVPDSLTVQDGWMLLGFRTEQASEK
ncbi:MAG: hypothetical protein Q4D98_08155 [Planctomycetia bacterium]|nr:hypothetical protein [Planctomycetia bacterium]